MPKTRVIYPDWAAPERVHALVTTRCGGFSDGPFASWNLATHVGDDVEAVRKNRQLLGERYNLPGEPIWLKQVHGNESIRAETVGSSNANGRLAADAAIACSVGRVCAVLTADCVPVLVCDSEGRAVGAIHAGWRGLASGVIEAAVAQFPRPSELLAWLGPAISAGVYEVGAEVRDRVIDRLPDARHAFYHSRPAHYHADLCALARYCLRAAGVRNISGGEFCTYGDARRFYSHRRDGRCGRMASLIWLACP